PHRGTWHRLRCCSRLRCPAGPLTCSWSRVTFRMLGQRCSGCALAGLVSSHRGDMMIRKLIAIGAALFALMFIAPAAQAVHCENVSRPVDTSHATAVVLDIGTVYVQGNWVVLPFEPDVWIFVPPGTLTIIVVADQVTPAGHTGNYI